MSTSASTSPSRPAIAGVPVPPMAIGTWSWGDSGMFATWDHNDADLSKIKEAWHACNAAGLTFYDTAEVYGEGKSERIIGQLRGETDRSVREKLYIATKYLPYPRPANFFVFTPGIVAACRKSLARLGVKQIDLYQIHANVGLHSIAAMGKELAQCVKLGLVKAVGVSNFNTAELIEMADVLAKSDVHLASNQVEFNLLRQLPETSGMLAEMRKRDITLLACRSTVLPHLPTVDGKSDSPLAMGRLTGKYSASNPVPKKRRFSSQFTPEQLEPLLDEMRVISKTYDVSVSAIALNWVISKGGIPLGGARDAKQAGENAKATTFSLTAEEVDRLARLGFEGKTSGWQHG